MAWKEYRKELKWVEKNYPNLKDKCINFIDWIKRNKLNKRK